MDRSRPKRYFYDQDYESETLNSRSKPRYSNNSRGGGGGGHLYDSGNHRRSSYSAGGGGRKMNGTSLMVTTTYRILCHDVKAGGVIGKSGSIIKTIRQHTGAWINVHEVIPGDEERIIEISDTRRRDPDDRMPAFSPAQEALFLIHERILETEVAGYGYNVGFGEDEDDEYGSRGGNRVLTRLVVSRMHVGSLMGKGGKIIEQMRIETKTHIRILPRDHNLPRCVDISEEIVQVVGDMNAVKKAIAIISSCLRESQHRDRSQFHNRLHSDNIFPPDDDFQLNSTSRRSSADGPNIGLRNCAGARSNNYSSRSSDNAHLFSGEEIVFRILCSIEKVDSVVGDSDGIVDLLQKEIGVNIEVVDPVAGSDEHIIIISSEEGPDDELFPAQEALLHIQTRIVDLAPEKGNIVTTRLLMQSDECGCLGLKDGSSLELEKFGGAKVNILSREELPVGLSDTCEIVQIVGEIKAAREALVEVTSSIRSYIHGEFFEKTNSMEPEAASNNNVITSPESQAGNGPVTSHRVKDMVPPSVELKQKETESSEDQPSVLNRISKPLVTRSTLEVVIPPHAAPLVTKPRKLSMISQISGATVKLIDHKLDVTEKIIQISGTPEQTERAQSLLQGFILSTEEDGP